VPAPASCDAYRCDLLSRESSGTRWTAGPTCHGLAAACGRVGREVGGWLVNRWNRGREGGNGGALWPVGLIWPVIFLPSFRFFVASGR
jgi:hypothetical protein